MKHAAIVVAVLITAGTAHADEDYSTEDNFDPLMFQIGVGFAARQHHDTAFDGTLRFGKIWGVGHHTYLGGFGELHTFSFSTAEITFGPQVQYAFGDLPRLQLRAGIGGGNDGPVALAGVQLAHAFIGGTLTGRRNLETDEMSLSFDVEVQPLLIAIAAIFGGSD